MLNKAHHDSFFKGGLGSGPHKGDKGHSLAESLERLKSSLKPLENEEAILTSSIRDINENSQRSNFDLRKRQQYKTRLMLVQNKIEVLRDKIKKINRSYNPDSEFNGN